MKRWGLPLLGGFAIGASGLTDGMSIWQVAALFFGLACFGYDWDDD